MDARVRVVRRAGPGPAVPGARGARVPGADPPVPGPAELHGGRQSAGRFDELVREMPEHYQAILFLRYREDLAYEEIAEALGIPLGTVKVRLHRAHEILRRKLTARGAKP